MSQVVINLDCQMTLVACGHTIVFGVYYTHPRQARKDTGDARATRLACIEAPNNRQE